MRVRPPSIVTALLWGRRVVRCAYPCRWVWSLVLGKDRRGRVTTDTARAAFVFVVCRLSFVVRLCRLSFVGSSVLPLSHFPTLGFYYYFGFWLASAGVSQLMLMLRPSCDGTDSVQRRFKGPGYLLVGRLPLVPWVFVAVLYVESRESRVESQVTSRSRSQATLRGPTSFICMMHRI